MNQAHLKQEEKPQRPWHTPLKQQKAEKYLWTATKFNVLEKVGTEPKIWDS